MHPINTNFITSEAGKQCRLTGQAAEYMVMSQLLLRGHNVAQYVIDNGVDLVVDNGVKLQIKSSNKRPTKSHGSKYQVYNFQTRWKTDINQTTGKKRIKTYNFENVDFVVFVCINDNQYFIVPPQDVPKWGITIYESMFNKEIIKKKEKYLKYLNAWNLITDFNK